MALAFNTIHLAIKNTGGRKLKMVELTTDAAYVTNGYPIAPSDVGLTAIELVNPGGGTGGFIPGWDQTNKKLKFYKTGATVSTIFVEAAASEAGLNGLKFPLLIVGY